MSKYTKKQRNTIYKLAKKMLRAGEWLCICHAIHHATLSLSLFDFHEESNDFDYELKVYFKEIYKQKPSHITDEPYWFEEGEVPPRIKILNKAIKETES